MAISFELLYYGAAAISRKSLL